MHPLSVRRLPQIVAAFYRQVVDCEFAPDLRTERKNDFPLSSGGLACAGMGVRASIPRSAAPSIRRGAGGSPWKPALAQRAAFVAGKIFEAARSTATRTEPC